MGVGVCLYVVVCFVCLGLGFFREGSWPLTLVGCGWVVSELGLGWVYARTRATVWGWVFVCMSLFVLFVWGWGFFVKDRGLCHWWGCGWVGSELGLGLIYARTRATVWGLFVCLSLFVLFVWGWGVIVKDRGLCHWWGCGWVGSELGLGLV